MQQHVIATDLLVAGGGMAGVCAAIAAARQGAKVVLVQDRSVLGGNASSEVRMHICGADVHGSRKGWRESGIIEELRLEDAVRNPQRSFPLWDAILYEKVVAEPNITLLLDTDIVGAEVASGGSPEDARPQRTQRMYEYHGRRGRITAARAVRNLTEDQFVIRAAMYADCTGDGRLGFEAGADFRIGRESRAMHGESLAVEQDDIHTLGNSILIMSRKHDRPMPYRAPAWARKFTPEHLKVGRPIGSWEYGFWWIEWGGMLDTIKDQCTAIRHELYAIVLGLWDYVKNSGRYPESADWALEWIGAIPGKRESRRFLGEHILSQQDLQEARVHEDEVAYGGWPIDIHPPKGIDDIDNPPFTPTPLDRVYGIPLRCYYSRNIENLFFAGRNISATHVAFASTRVMATCAVGGQAAGVAAALCVKERTTPSQIVRDRSLLARLQQHLLRQDATLPDTRLDSNLIHCAGLSASSCAPCASVENLRDGQTRDDVDPKTGELRRSHGWRSAEMRPGESQWVQLDWSEPVTLSQIHLWFDTGFQRQLCLSANDWTNSTVIRGPQPETVRDYRIEIDGREVVAVQGNYQRKCAHHLPQLVQARRVRIWIDATNGAPGARILEVAVYGG